MKKKQEEFICSLSERCTHKLFFQKRPPPTTHTQRLLHPLLFLHGRLQKCPPLVGWKTRPGSPKISKALLPESEEMAMAFERFFGTEKGDSLCRGSNKGPKVFPQKGQSQASRRSSQASPNQKSFGHRSHSRTPDLQTTTPTGGYFGKSKKALRFNQRKVPFVAFAPYTGKVKTGRDRQYISGLSQRKDSKILSLRPGHCRARFWRMRGAQH